MAYKPGFVGCNNKQHIPLFNQITADHSRFCLPIILFVRTKFICKSMFVLSLTKRFDFTLSSLTSTCLISTILVLNFFKKSAYFFRFSKLSKRAKSKKYLCFPSLCDRKAHLNSEQACR